MKQLILALIVTSAVVGGAVALYDEPAKASVAAGIDPLLMMSHADSLSDAHYDDYSVVFN